MDNNNNQKPQPNQIGIELTPATKVSYSNLAIISHSRSEFVLDFAITLPGLTPWFSERGKSFSSSW